MNHVMKHELYEGVFLLKEVELEVLRAAGAAFKGTNRAAFGELFLLKCSCWQRRAAEMRTVEFI